MKICTKLIIAGTTIGVAVAGVLIAKHFIKVDKENHSVQIIGGADGPISVFLAGKVPADRKQAGYISISMEEAKEVYDEFLNSGFTTILRDENRIIDETVVLAEKAFGL